MNEKSRQNAQFLSAKEVSKYLSVPLRTIQRLSKQGKIRAIKIGNKWKYSKEDIVAYRNYGTDFSKEPERIPSHLHQNAAFTERSDRSDRRSYPRINCNFKCQYLIDLTPFKNISHSGTIKNLGAGGILLLDSHIEEIQIDDPIKLQFVLNGKQETGIKTEGRVVRKDSLGLGIKFRNISSEDKGRIIKYVG